MNRDKMEHLCTLKAQIETECRALEAQCDELCSAKQQDENAIAETMKIISKNQTIAKGLINGVNETRLRNQTSRKALNKFQAAVGQLEMHSEHQIERCKQMLATNGTSRKEIKFLDDTRKAISSENKTLKSQLNDLKSESSGEKAKLVQNAAIIEAKRDSLKSDYESQLKQSRVNDATIQANENDLAQLMAKLDQKKDELANTDSRRKELEHKIENMEKQMRVMAQTIDSLRVARNQCAFDLQACQRLDLEISSLRKEIDFCAKTAREQPAKSVQLGALNDASKSVQAEKVVPIVSATRGHMAAAEEPNDVVRDIQKIRPVPRNTFAAAANDSSQSMASDIGDPYE